MHVKYVWRNNKNKHNNADALLVEDADALVEDVRNKNKQLVVRRNNNVDSSSNNNNKHNNTDALLVVDEDTEAFLVPEDADALVEDMLLLEALLEDALLLVL